MDVLKRLAGRLWRQPPRASAVLAPWDWPLRTKLMIALLVPSVLAVVLGTLRIADQTAEARELDRVARFVAVHGDIAGLVQRLQLERLRATTYVAGNRAAGGDEMQAAMNDVDAAKPLLRPTVENLYADDVGLVAANVQAGQALDRLPALRVLVTSSNAPPSAVVSRYSELIAQLVELDNVVLRGVNPTQINGLATALAGLDVARNETSLQEALMAVAGLSRQLSPAAAADLQASEARLRTGLNDFRSALDPAQRVRYAGLIAGATNTARVQLVQGVFSTTGSTGQAAQAQPVYDGFLTELDQAQNGVRTELSTTSVDRRQAATTSAVANGLLLLLALLVGAAVVLLIARQMISSLRTLREGALEVAHTQLPRTVARMREGAVPDTDVAPVPITTREDIGEVARAFDAVHVQAVRLAAEQALLQTNVNAMYVNLSRRSQTLVDHQLRLIENLEREEEDPNQLDSLFRLDHLATRMRRNCDNLLVLAGVELSSTPASVSILELLQAAISETSQYQRVHVNPLPPVTFVGRVSKDLRHVISELLDNATNFSPPESPVVISSAFGTGGALLMKIEDSGIGMPPEMLAAVNQQLGHGIEATAETARRMGLFVVGQLARRHGIGVHLESNGSGSSAESPAQGGITALVAIPPELIYRKRKDGGEAPTPTAVRPAQDPQANDAPPLPKRVPATAPSSPATPAVLRQYTDAELAASSRRYGRRDEERAPALEPAGRAVHLGTVRIPPYAPVIPEATGSRDAIRGLGVDE